MPRRREPDPVAKAVGARIKNLRQEAGLTLEKLAYESDLNSKGYLSDIEKGLARPTLATLRVIADHLEVDLLDLVTFPGGDDRAALIDATRRVPSAGISKLLRLARSYVEDEPAPRRRPERGGRRRTQRARK